MIRVLFICHGNICRSPMCEFVFKDMVERRSLQDKFHIESAATSTEEIWGDRGNPIYPPAQQELRKHKVGQTAYTNFSNKRARQVNRRDYDEYDYILCADTNNIRNILRIVGADRDDKIKLLLDYAVDERYHGRSIADPWYTGNFEDTYRDVIIGCEGLLEHILNEDM